MEGGGPQSTAVYNNIQQYYMINTFPVGDSSIGEGWKVIAGCCVNRVTYLNDPHCITVAI